MKWLFIMLVLANLAIFGWGIQREIARPETVVVEYPVVGDLRLLSEIDKEVVLPGPIQGEVPQEQASEVNEETETVAVVAKEIPLEGDVAPSTDVTEASPVEVVIEVHAEAETEIPPEEESLQPVVDDILEQKSVQSPVSNLPEESKAVTAVIDNSQESAVEAESEVAEAKEPELVTAAPFIPPEIVVQVPSSEEEALPPKDVALVCGAYGPFEKGSEARSVADRLHWRGVDSSLRQESYTKTIGYWVMIPPVESQEMAIQTVQELKNLGIKDVRRFFRGEFKNAISLGAFSQQKNADNRRQSLISKGYNVTIKPRYSEKQAYWLDYRDGMGESAELFHQLLEQYPAIDHQIYPCSRIVTSSGIN
ncbi:MAG: hypothetical protein RPU64_14135 [Candidatus Sedimenticola sp. (ex Thyasira tokunagai)]